MTFNTTEIDIIRRNPEINILRKVPHVKTKNRSMHYLNSQPLTFVYGNNTV